VISWEEFWRAAKAKGFCLGETAFLHVLRKFVSGMVDLWMRWIARMKDEDGELKEEINHR